MIRPLLVALREVRTYLQDKADLAFSLLLPIAIFALMYGAFGGQSLFHGTAHVVNEDRGGTYSGQLLQELDNLENLDVELLSSSDADARLERSDLLMVLYIPAGFSARLAADEPTQLVFKQRGNGGNEGQIVASLVTGVAEKMGQELQVYSQVRNTLAGSNVDEGRIEAKVQELLEKERAQPTAGVIGETVGSRPDPVTMFLPGIVTMFILFAITMTASTLVEERRLGTLERLMTTRLGVGQLFAGKFLANVGRGFVQTLILLALGYAVFQLFTPLSFAQALTVTLVFAAAASALGLVIASIARTPDQAAWTAVFFTMLMVMLGGTFFEIPEGSLLHMIGKASVNSYANAALKTIIAQGGSLADVIPELMVLGSVAIGALIVSRILFRVVPGGR